MAEIDPGRINLFLQEDPIKKAAQEYCDGNLYKGFTRPFQVKEIINNETVKQARKYANAYTVKMSNVEEEDISDRDREWEVGLMQVGQRFGVELWLPYWYYEK